MISIIIPCSQDSRLTYVLVFGAATDFVYAILPWFYIRTLKIGLKEKISVGVALSMGIFAGACSILKIYYTWTLGSHTDFTCKPFEHFHQCNT